MRTYISIGRVSDTLMLMSAIKEFACTSLFDIYQLSIAYGINKDAALLFAKQCNWLSSDKSQVVITPAGHHLLKLFDGAFISTNLWRLILRDYILICRPSWSGLIPSGRKETYLFMSDEEKRCFMESGLMCETDEETVKWWDSLSYQFRKESDERKSNTGRVGERLTIEYEDMRTGKQPIWQSLETNKAGYDIISIRDKNILSTLLIEVKSSEQNIECASAVVTRNEWEVASCKINRERYLFYFWIIGKEKRLAILSVDDIEPCIPRDVGKGNWEAVRIPFQAYSDRFVRR